jgi:hypothetical protein
VVAIVTVWRQFSTGRNFQIEARMRIRQETKQSARRDDVLRRSQTTAMGDRISVVGVVDEEG